MVECVAMLETLSANVTRRAGKHVLILSCECVKFRVRSGLQRR